MHDRGPLLNGIKCDEFLFSTLSSKNLFGSHLYASLYTSSDICNSKIDKNAVAPAGKIKPSSEMLIINYN